MTAVATVDVRPGQGVDRLRQLAAEPVLRQLLPQLQRHRSASRSSRRRSSDGGLTWSAPTTAPGFPGRESIRGAFAPGVQPLVAAERARRDRASTTRARSRRCARTTAARPGRQKLGDRAGRLPARTAACARRRSRPRRSARTAAPTSPGPTARSTLGCPANDIVYTSSVGRRSPGRPVDADPDRQRRRRAAGPRRRSRRARAGSRSRATSDGAVVARRRASSSVDDGRRSAELGAARSCSTRRRVPARVGDYVETSLGSMVGDAVSAPSTVGVAARSSRAPSPALPCSASAAALNGPARPAASADLAAGRPV